MTVGFLLLLLIGILPATPSVAEPPESTRAEAVDLQEETYNEILEKAIEHFYQTEWVKAGDMFDELKNRKPDDPRPYFFESMMPFWEYFLVEQRPELADRFLKQSETALELSQKKLERSPDDTTMVLLLSGLHGYRSLVAAGEKKYRVAIQSGMTGFSYTRQLLSLDSDRADAKVGRGMLYYMMGSVPGEIRWLTNAAGLKGDKQMGLKELEEAATSNDIIKYDAQLILMYLHEKEENYQKALTYAEMLAGRFEKNVLFHYKCGELQEKTGQTTAAVASYRQVVSVRNPTLGKVTEISRKRLEALNSLGSIDY